MTSNIQEYLSDEEENTEEVNTIRRNKRQRKWEIVSIFNTKEEAINAINIDAIWSFHYRNKTIEGCKEYYRCNKVRRRKQQCNAGIYLLFVNRDHTVEMFKTQEDHSHDELMQKTTKLSNQMKEEIKKLFELHVKPKRMFEILIEKGLEPKNKTQLSNYLIRLRKQNFGPSQISLGQIEQWCLDHDKIPDSDDMPFVVSHQIKYYDECEVDLTERKDPDGTEAQFRVLISTKRLLENCTKTNNIHVDATYKLIWEGMPVIIVGNTDSDRHFHPSGIAVCSNERTEDFKFIFESIIEGISKINGHVKIEYLISDASNAIRNAFVEAFGETKHLIMCWAHMRRNVMKKIDSLVDKSLKKEICDDIDTLQLAPSNEVFGKALPLFIKKWRQKRQNEFIEYMKLQWFTTHQNWFEGTAQRVPSTNNALESFNLVYKREQTFRERLPLSRFLELMKKSVEGWSNEYLNNSRIFMTSTSVELSEWTKGYHWAKSNVNISSVIFDNSIRYFCPSNEESHITENTISTVLEMHWNSFDQFKRRAFKVWIVDLPKEKDKWINGYCTCPAFLKKYVCKHIIGLAIRLKYVKPPPAAKQIPIGEQRKRGRPKLATCAFLVD